MSQDASRPSDAAEAVGPESSEPTAPEAAGQTAPEAAGQNAADAAEPTRTEGAAPQPESAGAAEAPQVPESESLDQGVHPDSALAAERLIDLQRLQAEYVNYKRRVDRDRAVVQERAVQSVLEALLPVLDDIHAAREHGDLEGGPFAAIAEKLESTLGKFGLERYGDSGEAFDPMMHEALMHTHAELPEGTEVTTVVQVLQPGYKAGEQVIRAARVAVADPQ
jgi:molecular chaperone GrpE